MPGNYPRVLAGRRVLVVDDVPMIQEIMQQLLELAGVEAALAGSGEEALRLLGAPDPSFDVVLMDLQMPVLDGLETTRRIRRQRGPKDLPIIALTSHDLAEERRRCFDAGMNDYLIKPVAPETLYETLALWTSTRPAPAASQVVASGALAGGALPGGASLPPLPGVHLEDALAHCAGELELVRDALRLFLVSYRGLGKELRQTLGAGRGDEAYRMAHNLKGAARTLGVTEVLAIAEELLGLLPRETAEVRALLRLLEERLGALCREIPRWLEATRGVAPARP